MPKGSQCGVECGAAPTTAPRLGNAVSTGHRPRLVFSHETSSRLGEAILSMEQVLTPHGQCVQTAHFPVSIEHFVAFPGL